ncbi:MAG: UvrD-helicase domain-containing protein, partial [Deltaproteobacteria bacterium]|nr:UvrD-helicase domain-containing protein [Deltaproteobacteria bacterium]
MNYEEIMSRYGKSSNFVVYSASAGTGKTHTITKEELKHIFEKGSSDLIAVTFTNAAAKEMKERIIEYLIEIAAAK